MLCLQVLGIERFGISHTFGSHHGHTRITRMAYMEGPEVIRRLVLAVISTHTARWQHPWAAGALFLGPVACSNCNASPQASGTNHKLCLN